MAQDKMVILSYFPFLTFPTDERRFTKGRDSIKLLEEHLPKDEDLTVKACLWAKEDEDIYPVFLIKKAKEAKEHMTQWAENRPQDWFHIQFHEYEGRYAIGIMPNLRKSEERLNLAHKLTYHEPISDKKVYLFSPWAFVSENMATYNKIKEKLDGVKKLKFAFLEVGDMTLETFDPNKAGEPYEVGVLDVVDDGLYKKYLNDLLQSE